jgi:hypothetical protein
MPPRVSSSSACGCRSLTRARCSGSSSSFSWNFASGNGSRVKRVGALAFLGPPGMRFLDVSKCLKKFRASRLPGDSLSRRVNWSRSARWRSLAWLEGLRPCVVPKRAVGGRWEEGNGRSLGLLVLSSQESCQASGRQRLCATCMYRSESTLTLLGARPKPRVGALQQVNMLHTTIQLLRT